LNYTKVYEEKCKIGKFSEILKKCHRGYFDNEKHKDLVSGHKNASHIHQELNGALFSHPLPKVFFFKFSTSVEFIHHLQFCAKCLEIEVITSGDVLAMQLFQRQSSQTSAS